MGSAFRGHEQNGEALSFPDPMKADRRAEGLAVPAQSAEGTAKERPAHSIPVLRPLLDTPFAGYVATMRLAAEGEASARPASDLLEPQVMEGLMRRFRPEDWPRDPRAVFSFWSQHYFLRLLPPALAANLLFGQRLPLELAEVQVVLDEKGLPALFLLKHEGRRLGEEDGVSERFQALREDHLDPLIAAWSRQAGVSERLFWSNVGRYLDWILAECRANLESAQVWRPLQVWLEVPCDRKGWRRRICCLRDRLAGVATCPDCPKARHV